MADRKWRKGLDGWWLFEHQVRGGLGGYFPVVVVRFRKNDEWWFWTVNDDFNTACGPFTNVDNAKLAAEMAYLSGA